MISKPFLWHIAKSRGQCGHCILEAAKRDAKAKKTSIIVTTDKQVHGHSLLRFRNSKMPFLSLALPLFCGCSPRKSEGLTLGGTEPPLAGA